MSVLPDAPPAELRLVIARRFMARLRGLHALDELAWGAGLWLLPCRAIHTVFMHYEIDVVFLDQNFRVIREVRNLGPNRFTWCPRAASAVELPAGYCAAAPDYKAALARAVQRTA